MKAQPSIEPNDVSPRKPTDTSTCVEGGATFDISFETNVQVGNQVKSKPKAARSLHFGNPSKKPPVNSVNSVKQQRKKHMETKRGPTKRSMGIQTVCEWPQTLDYGSELTSDGASNSAVTRTQRKASSERDDLESLRNFINLENSRIWYFVGRQTIFGTLVIILIFADPCFPRVKAPLLLVSFQLLAAI